MAHLFNQYITPRNEALRKLLLRGMREGEFRKTDPFHTSVTIAAMTVFYFSSTQHLRLLIKGDPHGRTNLKRRKQEVLDFIRHGLFTDPELP